MRITENVLILKSHFSFFWEYPSQRSQGIIKNYYS